MAPQYERGETACQMGAPPRPIERGAPVEAQRGASMGIRDACEVYRGTSDAHVERVVSRLCNVPQGWCAACGK